MTERDLNLPGDFLWGAATSAHQTEGDNTNSNWWHLENMPGSPFPDRSGRAVDAYNRYPEDMRLLADAGLNAYRFSIEWARIEPAPGRFDQTQIAHYRRMVETSRELGLTPVVTLHHFTNPMWFTADGGWQHPEAAERFARYVQRVVEIVHDVPWICTINEPNMIALLSGSDTGFASEDEAASAPMDSRPIAGKARTEPSTAVMQVLVDAHRRAVEILHASTEARVGWTVSAQAFEAEPGAEQQLAQVRWAWQDRFFEISRDDDFVGVQAYTTRTVGLDGPLPYPAEQQHTLTGWPFRPDAAGRVAREAWEITGGTPMLITESGIATADDAQRVAYIDGALNEVASAVDDGVDIRGFLYWSALDNYEWGEWGPTFGLIGVDLETFERTPRPSLAHLGTLAQEHIAQGASR
jgi:beta-glucosidase